MRTPLAAFDILGSGRHDEVTTMRFGVDLFATLPGRLSRPAIALPASSSRLAAMLLIYRMASA